MSEKTAVSGGRESVRLELVSEKTVVSGGRESVPLELECMK